MLPVMMDETDDGMKLKNNINKANLGLELIEATIVC